MTEDSFSTPRLPRRAPLLGQLLVERGLINGRQLEEALTRQRRLGGSLGTILLESEAIAEGKLLEMLGVQLSMPTVSAAEMQEIPREVLDLIPARLAHRYNLLPFQRRGNTLHLAALDPGAVFPVEDEIRMLTSCLLRAHIGLDFRIRDAIRQHYGGPGDVRLQSLARRLALAARRTAVVSSESGTDRPQASAPPGGAGPIERTPPSGLDVDQLVGLIDRFSPGLPGRRSETPRRQGEAPAAAPAPASSADGEGAVAPVHLELASRGDRASGAARPAPPTADETPAEAGAVTEAPAEATSATPETSPPVIAAETLEPTRAGNPFAGLEPTADDGGDEMSHGEVGLLSTNPAERLQEAAALLQDVELRDDVADAVLSYCAPYFSRRLLFVRRRGQILGWRGEGESLDLKSLPRVALPADEPSVFSSLESPGALHCGSLAPLPHHRQLEPLFEGVPPSECIVVPIFLGTKVACYLWLDRAGGTVAEGSPLHEIQELAHKAGYALEICVLRNRITSR